MSRKIDMSDPDSWTDEDLQYLSARGQLPKHMADRVAFDPEALAALSGGISQSRPLDEVAHTGTVNSAGLSKEEYDLAVELLRAHQENEDGAESSEDDDDEEEEDYDEGWNNDKRRAELSSRGLSTEGSKDELIARLLEDDASSEDEG